MSDPVEKNKMKVVADDSSKTFDANGVVGRKLKSFYDAIETEPLPDTLLSLLEKLDEAERKAGSAL